MVDIAVSRLVFLDFSIPCEGCVHRDTIGCFSFARRADQSKSNPLGTVEPYPTKFHLDCEANVRMALDIREHTQQTHSVGPKDNRALVSILDRVVGSDTDLLEDILLIVLLVVLLISMIQPGILVLVVVGAVGSHCSTSVLLFLDREIGSAEDCHQFCCVFFGIEELQNVGVHGVLLS